MVIGVRRLERRASSRGQRASAIHSHGFTLLELITVIMIVGILAAVALPNYKAAILAAREATLTQDLFLFRDVIDQFYADKGRYPASLEEVKEQGYLRKIPADPMTGQPDWEVVYAEPDPDDPTAQPGIYDVKSASTATSQTRGTPYNEW
ncbi:MAG: general secretion pathway protein GspG [Acidobacteria bacterium]|nr:MAG: general secretion pathway protein GspG [Acidobacteriota bacterium]